VSITTRYQGINTIESYYFELSFAYRWIYQFICLRTTTKGIATFELELSTDVPSYVMFYYNVNITMFIHTRNYTPHVVFLNSLKLSDIKQNNIASFKSCIGSDGIANTHEHSSKVESELSKLQLSERITCISVGTLIIKL